MKSTSFRKKAKLSVSGLDEECRQLQVQVKNLAELLVFRQELLAQLVKEPRMLTAEERVQVIDEMNDIYPDFILFLSKTFIKLTYSDLLLCCLIRLDFMLSEIAVIMGVDVKSVSKRKYRLKEYIRNTIPDISSLDTFIHHLSKKTGSAAEQYQWLHTEEERLLKLLVNKQTGTLKFLPVEKHTDFFLSINQLYPGFIACLRNPLLKLSYHDILTCCLVKLRFSTNDIAILTGIEAASVTTRKHRIQKKMQVYRLDIWEKYPSFDAYLCML